MRSDAPTSQRLVRLPETSAAPSSVRGPDGALDLATRLAQDLEGARRQITLGGSLLFVPITVAAIVGVAASVGVTGAALAVCALVGLAAGPGVTCMAVGMSTLLGFPAVKRRYLRRATALGLSRAEAQLAWTDGLRLLDDEARVRWSRRALTAS